MDETQIEKKDAGKFFRECILNEDPFEQFQNHAWVDKKRAGRFRRDGKLICPTCRKAGQTPENPFGKGVGSTEFISAEYKETLEALKIRDEHEHYRYL